MGTMGTGALVSVVIPTYNYGHFITKAIDSVIEQDYPHIEVIVVDDGSSDGTGEIVRNTYGKKVRYFFQNNKGVSAARNLGLEKVKGEFVAFLDADDWLQKTAIGNRVAYFHDNPDSGWVYGRCSYFDLNGQGVSAQYEAKYQFAHVNGRVGHIIEHLLMGELIHPSTIMVRSSVLQEVGLFREGFHQLEDYDFWLKVASVASAGLVCSSDVVVVAHDESASHSGNDNYRTLLTILVEAETSYPEAVQSLGRLWQQRISGVLVHRAMHLLADGDAGASRVLIKNAICRNPWHLRNYFYWFRTLI